MSPPARRPNEAKSQSSAGLSHAVTSFNRLITTSHAKLMNPKLYTQQQQQQTNGKCFENRRDCKDLYTIHRHAHTARRCVHCTGRTHGIHSCCIVWHAQLQRSQSRCHATWICHRCWCTLILETTAAVVTRALYLYKCLYLLRLQFWLACEAVLTC